MTEKFKILARFIKDLSSETPDIETFIFVKDQISKYQLGIDINSKPLKNKMVEINTTFKFQDKENNKKKSYFEIINTTIVKVNDEVKDKKELEKIILCDVQTKIYPDLEKSLLELLHNSGYPGVKFENCYWCHEKEVAAICSDTWGVEVRPNETSEANQPWHWVVIPAMGLCMGEIFYLKELAEDCAADGVYEFFFCGPPLIITGGTGSPINPQVFK